jgi:signal transduction histidine kinase
MERVREFSHELNPDVVERAGLKAALDRMVGRLRRNFPGTLRLMADSSLRIEPGLAEAFYRIAHEAVDNAIRHSGCTQVEVLLKSTRPGPALEVRDNGAGFDTGEAKDTGLGLLIMQHCAAEAGLDLAVSSVRQRGTTVRATLRAKTEHSGS